MDRFAGDLRLSTLNEALWSETDGGGLFPVDLLWQTALILRVSSIYASEGLITHNAASSARWLCGRLLLLRQFPRHLLVAHRRGSHLMRSLLFSVRGTRTGR